MQGSQQAHALAHLYFATTRQQGAAWPLHWPRTEHCGTRWAPTRAGCSLDIPHSGDQGGSGDGKGPCLPLPRGHLKWVPASQTTAMMEGKQKARIWSLGKKNISKWTGRTWTLVQLLCHQGSGIECNSCREQGSLIVCGLDHHLSMCETTFQNAAVQIHFKRF